MRFALRVFMIIAQTIGVVQRFGKQKAAALLLPVDNRIFLKMSQKPLDK